MVLDTDLNTRLQAALAKAYGKKPISWALSVDDFRTALAARDANANVLNQQPANDLRLLGLPCAPAGDAPSTLVVRLLTSDDQEEISV